MILWIILLLLACACVAILRLKAFPKWFSFLFAPLFIGLSLLLYATWGEFKPLQEKQMIDAIMIQMADLVKDKKVTRSQVIEYLDQIAIKSENAPFALARLATFYQQLGFFDKAMGVLARAIEISPHEEFQVQWIYNHSLKNHGRLDKTVRQIANELVENESTALVLLNLLAIDDYFKGEYENAIQGWQEILTRDQSLTADTRKVIEMAIEKAKLASIPS